MSFFHRDARYIKNITRFFTIMCDLVMIMILLNVVWHSYITIASYVYYVPMETVEHYNMELSLTAAEEHQIQILKIIMAFGIFIQLSSMYAYVIWMWCRFATTPGKFLFGARIFDADSLQKMTFKQANIRFFSVILSLVPCGLGIIWSVFDKRAQSWHDKLANTVVVVKQIESDV